MKITVSGSDSFLAHHLITALAKKGHQVLGFDLKKGKNTVDLLESYENFSFVECDITKPKELKRILTDIECVYHLAAVSSERFCREEPLKSFEVNVKGTLNLLEIAKEKKVFFVLSSSGSVYPDSDRQKKEDSAGFGGKFYGASKWIAEEYCRLFSGHFGFPCVILRFSRLYGPRMERNPVYDITKGLVTKDKICLYEGLDSQYDFIYVGDAVDALVNSLEGNWQNKIFNISSAQGIRLKELLALYFKIAGFELPVEVKRDISHNDILDNTKAMINVGFKPRVSLEEGLKETFLYFSKALSKVKL